MTVDEFLDSKNGEFMKFAELFTEKITDEELIDNLAQKDLEKLAKVFNLVFDRLEKSGQNSGDSRLEAILRAVSPSGEEESL